MGPWAGPDAVALGVQQIGQLFVGGAQGVDADGRSRALIKCGGHGEGFFTVLVIQQLCHRG